MWKATVGLKRIICFGAFFAALNLGTAWGGADGYVASVTRQLQEQGYNVTAVSKTLLGRIRFEARREDVQREIVINPRTGEVLRDLNRTIAGVEVVVPEDTPTSKQNTAIASKQDDLEENGTSNARSAAGVNSNDSSDGAASDDGSDGDGDGDGHGGDGGDGDGGDGGDGDGGDGDGGDGDGDGGDGDGGDGDGGDGGDGDGGDGDGGDGDGGDGDGGDGS